jgi:hypothetical protein
MHPFAITADGSMYVDVGTATNSCQLKNRTLKSPGADPCTELETRGGIWRYDANKTNQPFSPADRFATGIRNGEGFAVDATGKRLFVTQHGRDQLHSNWPDLYKLEQEATLPAEELLLLKQGGDYGWPECYYDAVQQKLVLAPEYGGDGGKKVGVCAEQDRSGCGIPRALGAERNGVLRPETIPSPLPQRRVHRLPRFMGSGALCPRGLQRGLSAAGRRPCIRPCEIFADGFAGRSRHRRKPCIVRAASQSDRTGRSTFPTIIPDGSTGLSMLAAGWWRREVTPCPVRRLPRPIVQAAKPPEGTHPDAGLSVPAGATQRWWRWVIASTTVKWAERRARVAMAPRGKGTPLGPDLTDKKWLWSDGSYAGIAKTITDGVMQPKEYRSPCRPWEGLNSQTTRCQPWLRMSGR